MKKVWLAVILVAVLVVGVMPAAAQEPLIDSACLVTDEGRVNDASFNQFAYEGMLRAEQDFDLEVTVIETAAPTDYPQNISTCIDEGYDAVITVGFLMETITREKADEYPDIYFIGIDQFHAGGPANLVGTQSREDQMGYAVGVMAALMTESGTVGGVFGREIPPVAKFRNGYESGIRATNPDIEVLGLYIDSFNAPERGQSAAEQFLGEGADVLFGGGGQTGNGAILYGAQQGALVIGVDQDQYYTVFGGGDTPGAENIMTSAVKRVDESVYLMLEALVNGGEGFPGGGNFVGDVTNGAVDVAPPHDADVPQDVIDAVDAVLVGLADGTIVTGVDPASGALLPNLVEVATEAGDFSTLLAAADAAGLVETLTGEGPFTVFAPTDEAFAAALEELGLTADELLADTETLTDILLYHVVPAAPESKIVVGMDSLTTVQGGEISLSVVDGVLMLNDSVSVVAADIPAANGLIHVIDGVLLPE
jgi:basic membrane protein A and related proteins